MPSLSQKQMLEEILKHAALTPSEHEMFGDIWDAAHRYKSVTKNQGHLIEKVYFAQKLDRGERPRLKGKAITQAKGQIAVLTYKGVDSEKCVTNMLQFSQVCQDIKPGSEQYEKIAGFFRAGGRVLKIQPKILV